MTKQFNGKVLAAGVVQMSALAVLIAAPAVAQQPTASVHGHITNAAGMPLNAGVVKFTRDKGSPEATAKVDGTGTIDKDGSYTVSNLPAGSYFMYTDQDDKHLDRLEVTLKPGDNLTVDDDMSRAEYIEKMTPEEKKQLEDYKKKAGEAINANKVISNLNATLKKVRADLAAAAPTKGDVSQDVTDMQSAVAAKPDEGLLYLNLGDALQAQGDHLAAADKAASKAPMSDDAVVKEYSDAADAYKKGIDLETASKKPNPNDEAIGYNQMANVLAKAGKTQESTDAYESAAKLSPANAGMYYNNEAAIMFNSGKNDAALAAAEKAIAADPTRPDPYFIKGQVLIAGSTFDAKTQKLVAPPGCVEAYQKYLELAPNGTQAQSVKEVLQSLGEKIDTKYKAGKK